LDRFQELTADNPRQQAAVKRLRLLVAQKQAELAETIAFVHRGEREAALNVVRSGRGSGLTQQIDGQIASMREEEERLLRQRTATAKHGRILGWASVLLLAVTASFLLWLTHYVARRDERWLRASEERLATTLRSIGEGVIATDKLGRIERMNPSAEHLTGWTFAEASGKTLETVFRTMEEGASTFDDSIATKVLGEGRAFSLPNNSRLLARDDREYIIASSAAPIKRANGIVDGVVVVFRDVTERRNAERARLESERRYRQVLESLPQLVWTCSSSGETDFLSRQWLDYTGATLEKDLGYGWLTRIHPDDRDRLLRLWEASVESGIEFDTQARIRRADGRYFWFKQRAVPIKQTEGVVQQWFGTSTDITDVIEAHRQVERANCLLERRVEERTAELSEANSELEAFAHTVAHDLRAPLRNIQGYASAILEDEHDRMSDEGTLYAQRMADSATRMDRLIQDLLSYSRLSRSEIHLERIDTKSVLTQVLEEMSTELAAREAQVTVAEDLPAVIGQRAILEQVFSNLISNAVKFVAPDVLPKVVIGSSVTNGEVRFSLTDNGIGIAPEHRERVFRVFERLHGSERYPGTGIGLAIVRRGVERMGGRVWLESPPQGGTRFCFELRAADVINEGT
jgi:PAS domain S-box-containing protein